MVVGRVIISFMEPNQMPSEPNKYDYILNPNRPAATKAGFAFKNKKLVSVAFIAAVILLVVIVLSIFFSLTRKNYSGYISLAQQQTEILRIATASGGNTKEAATKNYVQSIASVVLSQKNATLEFVKKNHVKVKDSVLDVKKSSSADKQLDAAKANNSYDKTLAEILNNRLNEYKKSVGNLSAKVSSKSEKTLIQNISNDLSIISKN